MACAGLSVCKTRQGQPLFIFNFGEPVWCIWWLTLKMLSALVSTVSPGLSPGTLSPLALITCSAKIILVESQSCLSRLDHWGEWDVKRYQVLQCNRCQNFKVGPGPGKLSFRSLYLSLSKMRSMKETNIVRTPWHKKLQHFSDQKLVIKGTVHQPNQFHSYAQFWLHSR